VGGIPEIIEDDVNGLLVPPRDPQALAQAILRLLQDPELAQRLARAGQEHVRMQFSFERLLLETCELYKEGLQRKAGRREKSRAQEEARWGTYSDPATVGLEELEASAPDSPAASKEAEAR
jgi:hypothetical protein